MPKRDADKLTGVATNAQSAQAPAALHFSRADVTAPSLDVLSRLHAYMLAPHDPDMRAQLRALWFLEHQVAEIREGGGQLSETVAVPMDFLLRLARWPSFKDLIPSIEKAQQRGLAVGSAVSMYYQALRIGEHFNREQDYLGHFTKAVLDECGLSTSWFNNKAWPEFKAVAHLWAAQNIVGDVVGATQPMCGVLDATKVLQVAIYIQRFAISHIPMRQRDPLIGKDELLLVPDDLFTAEEREAGMRIIAQREALSLAVATGRLQL